MNSLNINLRKKYNLKIYPRKNTSKKNKLQIKLLQKSYFLYNLFYFNIKKNGNRGPRFCCATPCGWVSFSNNFYTFITFLIMQKKKKK